MSKRPICRFPSESPYYLMYALTSSRRILTSRVILFLTHFVHTNTNSTFSYHAGPLRNRAAATLPFSFVIVQKQIAWHLLESSHMVPLTTRVPKTKQQKENKKKNRTTKDLCFILVPDLFYCLRWVHQQIIMLLFMRHETVLYEILIICQW